MVKRVKRIEVNKQLTKEDESKIDALLKTYETGTIKHKFSFSELHDQNSESGTLIEMEVQLTSDSFEDLKQLEKEFDLKIKEEFGDKVKISSSNIMYGI